MNHQSIRRQLTVAEYAESRQIDAGKVLQWIASGELRAINVAQNRKGVRPRWRITEEDIAAFEMRRANVLDTTPAAKPTRQTRSPRPANYTEYV